MVHELCLISIFYLFMHVPHSHFTSHPIETSSFNMDSLPIKNIANSVVPPHVPHSPSEGDKSKS